MSSDDPPSDVTYQSAEPNGTPTPRAAAGKPSNSIFSVPAPLKRVFDRFPLATYAENEPPLRAPKIRDANTLHVFTTEDDARKGRPSFNPACLKWQTYLKIAGLPFMTVPSTNHASPSGALPFLTPSLPAGDVSTPTPVASNRLKKWLGSQIAAKRLEGSSDFRSDAFVALLDNDIRKAWLYQLYMNPSNASLVHRLYVEPCSTNILVQLAIGHQLAKAATDELVKSSNSNTISEEGIMQSAYDAFEALSDLLDADEWFFGLQTPSIFDASVFAYTHLILDSKMHWEDNRLEALLMHYGNLVQHRYRMLEMYF